ncbi:Hsp20/alpha crystallin family protein [Marispirochaeta sp.]|uniref:Hsp20/alpha crystallin family protein n=1 Tax=Marispirochaeta sp. TaxID=2038653 RepID=UPI0029C90C74|nr:Hsp20/alpha crystallin family protein [Marispirochaeta sp.]
MKDKIIIDLGQIMDDLFDATQNFGGAFKEGFRSHPGNPFFQWDDSVDYYPAYSYPPANIFFTPDKSLVFEFALAGFSEKQISLEFKGDYMMLNARLSEDRTGDDKIKYLKHRLKFKEIVDQKYYAPEDKFDRNAVRAIFRNGILTVSIPARKEAESQKEIKIEIVKEEE